MKPQYVFVLEQSLGHAVHGARLERTLARSVDCSTRVIRVLPGPDTGARWPPGHDNMTLRASWVARRALHRHLADHRVDALYFHTQVSALLVNAIMRSVPTVISMDATPANYDSVGGGYHHVTQGAAAEWLKRRVYRKTFKAATALVTFSHWAAASLAGDYDVSWRKIHVIRPGVDVGRFCPRPRGVGDRPLRVLFVGGDFVRKGGEELLDAVARLGPQVELDIVTSHAPIQTSNGTKVRVHRGVAPDSDELLDLYRQADVLALPSRAECYGHVVVEALASGLPVVACPVGAIPEMVRHDFNGLLVPPGSPAALAEALRRLVQRPDLRRTMGERGRQMAQREHDVARNHQSLLELMRRISVSRRPRSSRVRVTA